MKETLGGRLAPEWAMNAGTIGHALILSAAFVFLAAAVAVALQWKAPRMSKVGAPLFALGVAFLFGAFGALTALFLTDQFQYSYVFGRSEESLAAAYKVASVWSGQQGSFLLWACTAGLFGLLALRAVGSYRRWFVFTYSLILAALAAILAYETPFGVIPGAAMDGRTMVPPNGAGMTPALQNYWVVIHPPIIFLGFGSLTVLFCWAMSAMMDRDLKSWVAPIRPWALTTLAILALGICLGGFWAYETLGWGGFWGWDPVENASFIPWLFVVAFVHGLIVQSVKGKWAWTNALLGGLPFLWFAYGTFLTRSGFLSEASVHSFAEMDRKALLILLGLLVVGLVSFFGLWLTRGRLSAKSEPQSADSEPGFTRESAYKGGVLTLSLLGIAIGIGTSIPFFMGVLGRPTKVVEEGLYHQVMPWFFLPLMVLVAAGPFLSWRAMGMKALINRMANVLSLSVGILGFCVFVFKLPALGGAAAAGTVSFPFGMKAPLFPWVMALLFFCLLAAIANLWRLVEVWKRGRSSAGAFISHVGLAVLLAGLIVSRGLEQKQQVLVQPGIPTQALGYIVQFEKGTSPDMFDRSNKVLFKVQGANREFIARPGLYYVRNEDRLNAMVWPHVEHGLAHDIYFTLYEPVVDVWKEPQLLQPGEVKSLNNISVRFVRPTREGQPGQPGARFGAELEVKTADGTFRATPSMVLTEGGVQSEPADVPGFKLAMDGMDVASGAVRVQVHFWPPIYPVELFHKPMTILVWAGTGILVLGGLLSAFARRRDAAAVARRAGEAGTDEDAPIPAS